MIARLRSNFVQTLDVPRSPYLLHYASSLSFTDATRLYTPAVVSTHLATNATAVTKRLCAICAGDPVCICVTTTAPAQGRSGLKNCRVLAARCRWPIVDIEAGACMTVITRRTYQYSVTTVSADYTRCLGNTTGPENNDASQRRI